jgi:hypothetical protein
MVLREEIEECYIKDKEESYDRYPGDINVTIDK